MPYQELDKNMGSVEKAPTIPTQFERTLEKVDAKIGSRYKLGIRAPSDIIEEGQRAYLRRKNCGCYECDRSFIRLAVEYAIACGPYDNVYSDELETNKDNDEGGD